MIELEQNTLVVSFPEVHPKAVLAIDFQRTLRIPDDGKEHSLPPGLGRFPLRHVDDFAARVPSRWRTHGGVMLPMYQAEAMWLNFTSFEPRLPWDRRRRAPRAAGRIPELRIGGMGFCEAVWGWDGAAYVHLRNEAREPGACD